MEVIMIPCKLTITILSRLAQLLCCMIFCSIQKHNKNVAKEKLTAEKLVEQLRKRNQALRERLAGENKRAHDLELKVRNNNHINLT